jgi:hypothetical protein
MSRLIGRKLLMRLGSGGGANRVRRFYRLLPRRVKSDRLLASGRAPARASVRPPWPMRSSKRKAIPP